MCVCVCVCVFVCLSVLFSWSVCPVTSIIRMSEKENVIINKGKNRDKEGSKPVSGK